jgi:monoamine oxidase
MYIPHIIIGGGIAGLYIACQLLKKKQEFLLFEASKRPNNKLVSIKEGNTTLELGASVFHINQPKLLHFLEKLELADKVTKHKKTTKRYVFDNYSSDSIATKFQIIFQKAQNHALASGMSLATVEENAMKCLTNPEFTLLKTCWDCWYENANMNAYIFYQQNVLGMTFYSLSGGLSQIIKAAMDLCKTRILMNHKVDSVQYDGNFYEITVGKTIYMCRKLYVCVSLDELENISFDESLTTKVSLYKSLGHTESSMRCFIVLNREIRIDGQMIGQLWCKWIIRITPSIYMIYVDNDLANSINKLSDEDIVEKWMWYINASYGYNLTRKRDLKKIIRAYWPTAYTILNKQYFTEQGNKIRESLPFVCTALPKPYNQAYMEGHLYDV